MGALNRELVEASKSDKSRVSCSQALLGIYTFAAKQYCSSLAHSLLCNSSALPASSSLGCTNSEIIPAVNKRPMFVLEKWAWIQKYQLQMHNHISALVFSAGPKKEAMANDFVFMLRQTSISNAQLWKSLVQTSEAFEGPWLVLLCAQ